MIFPMRRTKKSEATRKTRRSPDFDLHKYGAPPPEVSDEVIKKIVKAVKLPLSEQQQETLKAHLTQIAEDHYLMGIRPPATWEVAERLNVVRNAAESLWAALGVNKKPEQVNPHLRVIDIQSALAEPVRDAADVWGRSHEPAYYNSMEIPDGVAVIKKAERPTEDAGSAPRSSSTNIYSHSRLRDIVGALAMLMGWVDIAQRQVASKIDKDLNRKPPDHLSIGTILALSNVYREVYQRTPTTTEDGPWIRFLQITMKLVCGKKWELVSARERWKKAKKRAFLK